MKNKNFCSGFTLIELCVVTVLVGLLALAMTQIRDPGQLEVREARRGLAVTVSRGLLQKLNSEYGAAASTNVMQKGFWCLKNGDWIPCNVATRHRLEWIENDGCVHYTLQVVEEEKQSKIIRVAQWNLYDSKETVRPFATFNLPLRAVQSEGLL